MSLLSSEFRYVIIDTGSGLDEPTLAVLQLCTDIILLTSTDVPSVRATRKEVEMLDLLGLDTQERHFVVNRADARVGLPVSEVEATVGRTADVTIPSSRAVPISVNHGTPVVVSERRSPVGDAMGRLVARFVPNAPAPEAGLLRRYEFGDGVRRYELSQPEEHHHHYIRCRACGSLEAFDGCDFEDTLARLLAKKGYQMIRHTLDVQALCRACHA